MYDRYFTNLAYFWFKDVCRCVAIRISALQHHHHDGDCHVCSLWGPQNPDQENNVSRGLCWCLCVAVRSELAHGRLFNLCLGMLVVWEFQRTWNILAIDVVAVRGVMARSMAERNRSEWHQWSFWWTILSGRASIFPSWCSTDRSIVSLARARSRGE